MSQVTDLERTSRWRWSVQGGVLGVLIAVVAVLILGWVRNDPIAAIRTEYSTPPTAVGDHELQGFRVTEVRQPSSIPAVPGIGGEEFVAVVVAMNVGVHDMETRLDLRNVKFTVYAVATEDREREELILRPESQSTMAGLTGVIDPGQPFWLNIEYAMPSLSPHHYEIVVEIAGENYSVKTEGART